MEESRRCVVLKTPTAMIRIGWVCLRNLFSTKRNTKNTIVPICHGEEPKLGWWAFTQRHNYKNDALLPGRFDLLNSVGFDWEVVKGRKIDNGKWISMFQNLIEYKRQHKNTTVTQKYDEDPKLGLWVSCQRMKYKHDKLLPSRYALLNPVRFEWVVRYLQERK